MRPNNRSQDQMRDVRITRNYTKHAEGSVLIEFGDTKVICNATAEERVPRWMKNAGKGWVTAEYGMLPRSTNTRMGREASHGKQGGRTMEIQRLIGRSLRASVNLEALNGITITVDCDVIQADGGTRTAAITGGFVAMADAIQYLIDKGVLPTNPILSHVASISVGILDKQALLDLEYVEDSTAETDMNVVMNEAGEFIEVQGTAEGVSFSRDELNILLDYADKGIRELIQIQKQALL